MPVDGGAESRQSAGEGLGAGCELCALDDPGCDLCAGISGTWRKLSSQAAVASLHVLCGCGLPEVCDEVGDGSGLCADCGASMPACCADRDVALAGVCIGSNGRNCCSPTQIEACPVLSSLLPDGDTAELMERGRCVCAAREEVEDGAGRESVEAAGVDSTAADLRRPALRDAQWRAAPHACIPDSRSLLPSVGAAQTKDTSRSAPSSSRPHSRARLLRSCASASGPDGTCQRMTCTHRMHKGSSQAMSDYALSFCHVLLWLVYMHAE